MSTTTKAKATKGSRKANPKARAGGALGAMEFKLVDEDAAKAAGPTRAKEKENRKESGKNKGKSTERQIGPITMSTLS